MVTSLSEVLKTKESPWFKEAYEIRKSSLSEEAHPAFIATTSGSSARDE
jgi:hypothetical protein